MELNISNVFLVIGFILWLIYLFLYTSKEINIKNKETGSYAGYVKEHFVDIFRLDKLLLIVVFYFYTKFENASVTIYLFDTIMLFFLVNILYDKIKWRNISFLKEKMNYLLMLVVGIMPIVVYFVTENSFMSLMIVLLICYFYPLLFILFNKINKMF